MYAIVKTDDGWVVTFHGVVISAPFVSVADARCELDRLGALESMVREEQPIVPRAAA